MKLIRFASLMLLMLAAMAFMPIAEQEVTSVIKRVTVFTSGAQVFRDARTTVGAGQTTLKFVNLAPTLIPTSINIKAPDNVLVLSVQHRYNFLAQKAKEANIKEVEEKIKSLNMQREDLQSEMQVYSEEKSLLQNNKIVYGQENGLKAEELRLTADLLRSRMLEINAKIIALNRQVQQITEDMNKFQAQLGELRTAKDKEYSSEIIVTVSSKSGTTADFELSYLVSTASWIPSYDIRVKDVLNPISLAYKADISQQSGEEWKDVN